MFSGPPRAFATPAHAAGRARPAAVTGASGRSSFFAEAADVLSPRIVRPVRHVDLPLAQWVEGAEANGLLPAYAVMLGGLFDVIRGGHTCRPACRIALDRPPTSIAA